MTLDDWLEHAREDDRIVGVVLTGSRGRNAMVHDASDWDVRVAVADGHEALADSLDTPHGSEIEVAATTVSHFPTWPAWDRYSFAHATVLVDKLGGEFERIVARLGSLNDSEATTLACDALGAYTNSLYRSLKNADLDLDLAARLDAAESVSTLLTALFAFEGRIRPFNKYLSWELHAYPLNEWQSAELITLVEEALTGRASSARDLFRAVEPRIREHGLGDVVDDWHPHVPYLRGA
jgi:hypothetical protein